MSQGYGSEVFRIRGPRGAQAGSVVDLSPEERARRKAENGFGKGFPFYKKPKPLSRTSAQERIRMRRMKHAEKVETRLAEEGKRHEYELAVAAERKAEDKRRAYMRLLDEAIARAKGEIK